MADSSGGRGSRRRGPALAPARRREELPRGFVELHQRRRAAGALATLAHEEGIAAVTTSAICGRARMSRTTFYALFGSLSNCRRFAFTEAYGRFFGQQAEAGDSWLAVGSLFASISAEPAWAELCLVHCFAMPDEARGHGYEAALESVATVMAGGRQAGRARLGGEYREPPRGVEELLAGAIVSLAALRTRQDRARELPRHHDELLALVATCFGIGTEARGGRRLEAV